MTSLTTWMMAFLLSIVPHGAQEKDVTGIMGGVRQALGGDATLGSIKSFSMKGGLIRDLFASYGNVNVQSADGQVRSVNSSLTSVNSNIEIYCVLPDNFLRVSWGRGTSNYSGFTGDNLIFKTESILLTEAYPQGMPELLAAERTRLIADKKLEFARLTLALFGASLSCYPLQLSYAGEETIDGIAADVVEARSKDKSSFRMYLDARTHLPMMLCWLAEPIPISGPATGIVIDPSERGSTVQHIPLRVQGDTVGKALLEHRLYFSDYRISDGVNWPRKWREYVEGKLVDDMKLAKCEINAKISLKKFKIY